MLTCSFCKKSYPEHKGLTVYGFDGKGNHYCSSKCRRNTALKREPKKVNWIKRKKKEKAAKSEEKEAKKIIKGREKIAESAEKNK